ncbi:MAG: hypothetical protein K8L99_11420 [Anaerolineae bacterium]|nr:hypothetical protein [Anaerolineae bacterium]
MKRALLFSLIIVAVTIGFSYPRVVAQSDCTSWSQLAYSAFDRYNGVREGRDIQTAAQIQALRREVEAFDISICPAGEELYDALIQLLNLSSDSIVAGLADDPALAGELSFQMTDRYLTVAQLILEGPTVVAQITSPADESTVTRFDITIEGTYDPEALGENALWAFVKSPQQVYFPQIVNGCDTARRASVALNPQRQTWSIPGYLGSQTAGIGDTFEIVLFVGGEEAEQFVYDYFDNACAANSYPGLTADEIYSGVLEEVDFVKVTRTQ